ncbi:1-aminocyclopropane-2-carboxylate synthase 2 [Trichoderma arundinaceum]|uniref:1-aminocyclopropane-2-carboxylate synthase 2 n=1 Tax=Trichoderma arundinaceum TaxID=490622 RepID=A0A395NZF6_TRIAR|nr:1-aminocyclopropane-2-carboxylate synthase 2 [Trichoderma arundinaceum]
MSLSARAKESEKASQELIIWKVLQDLWDPDTKPSGIVSLGVAENRLMHDILSKHIHENLTLSNHAFTYGDGASGSNHLRKSMSRFLNKHLKPIKPIQPAHISITNGCSAAIEHLSWAFANPGEAFLLGQPYYGTFIEDLTARTGSKVVPVPFQGIDPLSENAVAKYEEALKEAEAKGTKVSGLVLCNPHNPLGRCYSRDALIGILRLCQRYQIHFISDEIYALSVWENTVDTGVPLESFTSCLSIDPDGIIDPSLVHVIWGMSKDFGANGIRVGALVSQANQSLHAALIPVNLYSSASSISDHATANILDDDCWVESYVAENRRRLAQQYKSVVSWAKENGITYRHGVNAAFFLWVDLGSIYKSLHPDVATGDLNKTIATALLRRKVFLASGTAFGSEEPGWFRIVFSHPDDYLHEGLKRVLTALKDP